MIALQLFEHFELQTFADSANHVLSFILETAVVDCQKVCSGLKLECEAVVTVLSTTVFTVLWENWSNVLSFFVDITLIEPTRGFFSFVEVEHNAEKKISITIETNYRCSPCKLLQSMSLL